MSTILPILIEEEPQTHHRSSGIQKPTVKEFATDKLRHSLTTLTEQISDIHLRCGEELTPKVDFCRG